MQVLLGGPVRRARSFDGGESAMGADPYWYVVKYRPDVNEALQELREREFRAGRYNPVIPFPNFPIGPHSPAPGARHATMAEALEDAEADGTRSIIDLDRVADEPDYGAVTPLKDTALRDLFGTTRPTREMVESNHDFWENLERGQGISIVLYKDDRPDEIYFAGYSYD
jgi:hypothetical protein